MAHIKRIPAPYVQPSEDLRQHLSAELPHFIRKMRWRPNELILDHGSGTGLTCLKYVVPKAEETNSRIYAIDNSESMIASASGIHKYPNLRVSYICGQLGSNLSPLLGLKFNKIFSLYTLHLIDDFRNELREVYNLLKSKGEILMIIPVASPIFELIKKLTEYRKWRDLIKGHLVYPQWLNEKDKPVNVLLKEFMDLGFEITEVHCRERVYDLSHTRFFTDFLVPLHSFANLLSPMLYDELKEYYQTYAYTESRTQNQNSKSVNPKHAIRYTQLIIHANKS